MNKKKKGILVAVWVAALILTAVGAVLVGSPGGEKESIKEAMRDAVLHERNVISLFGIKNVNPAFISALCVTGILLLFAAVVRIFVIPRFRMKDPGKFQILLERLVGYFDSTARTNSPHRNGFLGAYIFAAGVYIFVGTVFELFGFQAVTVNGDSIALPAPLADINGAIAMGCISYLAILNGGIVSNGFRGVGSTLKEFSLPISMSFRLFGALLSGLLVTELVYYYLNLSFVLPVAVGVMFTLLHALIQTYVLITLTALFYGKVSAPPKKKAKNTEKNTEKSA